MTKNIYLTENIVSCTLMSQELYPGGKKFLVFWLPKYLVYLL